MRQIITFILAAISLAAASADTYSYDFSNTPLAKALVQIGREHPEVNLSLIYNELNLYRTSASVRADNATDAISQAIDSNPVSVIEKNGTFYVEALQHGHYRYHGRAIDSDNEPVAAARIMLLAPGDSAVITYGLTDEEGRFTIPCDNRQVIVKAGCIGYKTAYKLCNSFAVGDIVMESLPIQLGSVTVVADKASLYSDKSIFRPTQQQRKSSQTATELLNRMAIPQINARLGSESLSTVTGQPIAIYIDYVPASASELRMMRTTDVKSVEYLEFPTDPRFQGSSYVINFRMQKYEYGGYIKTLASESLIANSGLAQTNARLQRNKMTFDVMGYGYYMDNRHIGFDRTETFRLPSDDNGRTETFQRRQSTESSHFTTRNFETSVRALYNADKITANTQIAFGGENTPRNNQSGITRYTPSTVHENSEFSSTADNRSKYLSYNGYYYFSLPHGNSLTAQLDYQYSRTAQSSMYEETGFSPIANGAHDNTNSGSARITYNQTFGRAHSIKVSGYGLYETNRTAYSGSLSTLDRASTKSAQAGAGYNFNNKDFSGSLGFGWDWVQTALNDNEAYAAFPYADAFLNYSINRKNSFNIGFHYSVWPPSSNYKSDKVIQVSPFMRHTGNPHLKSHRSFDFGFNYTFVPTQRFNMTAFGYAWLVGNRAAFVYKATPEGILRTIEQPIGRLSHYTYGINASTTQLNGNLQLSGQVAHLYVRDGAPFEVTHSQISYYLQAMYYAGQFNFAIAYQSPEGTINYDSMAGTWWKKKCNLTFQAGWSNSVWNLQLTAQNLQRWNWVTSRDAMESASYSVASRNLGPDAHALIKLSATYTFGFGKKVDRSNDISKQSGASSGILK